MKPIKKGTRVGTQLGPGEVFNREGQTSYYIELDIDTNQPWHDVEGGWANRRTACLHQDYLTVTNERIGAASTIVALENRGANIPYKAEVLAGSDGRILKYGSRTVDTQSAETHIVRPGVRESLMTDLITMGREDLLWKVRAI